MPTSDMVASPWMNDELRLLDEQASRFIARELVPCAERWRRDGRVDAEAWRKTAEAGLFCIAIPEEYGGGGGSLRHEAVVQAALVRAGLAGDFAICHSIHSCIVAHYIYAYGTDAQKQRWLPAMASGALIGGIAMTEPETGSDLQAVRTRAERVAEGWRLNGQKTFISNGQTATLVLVVARTSPEPGGGALSLVAVETEKASGFRRGRNLAKLGLHGQDTSELFFEDVLVPAENLLGGQPGQGFAQLMQQLAWERMLIAITAVGNMERAIRLTVEYTRERQAFGRSLLDFQNTQFVLADAKTQSRVGREFLDGLLARLFDGTLDATTAAMAKLWTTETAFKVIDSCQQLFGGYGYMEEYPIARLFADTRVARVYGGANEIMKLIIARSL